MPNLNVVQGQDVVKVNGCCSKNSMFKRNKIKLHMRVGVSEWVKFGLAQRK